MAKELPHPEAGRINPKFGRFKMDGMLRSLCSLPRIWDSALTQDCDSWIPYDRMSISGFEEIAHGIYRD
ncbi:MAG: hypothetical protein ABSE63_12780 [Thermoguttaceae bacterium]|jgi:hypothetical protein